jgi:uncharacterized protein YjbI with pentapeptide repeats
MANDDHVALLKQGVAAWNAWRDRNHNILPDLNEANLIRVNLIGAHLGGAHLSGANLVRANLSGADLSGADLSEADLSGSDLSGTRLGGANLTGAHLGGANLSGANLSGANLGGAHLGGEANLGNANLSGAHLGGAHLSGSDLSGSDLSRANLSGADLSGVDLTDAHLIEAHLGGANLRSADLRRADLSRAHLSGAHLGGADLGKADLSGSDLSGADLLKTDLTDAILTGCRIYGVSAWNLKLEGATQQSLIITPQDEPTVTVDNIEVAQFVYLLLHNEKIRDVIDTIGKKGVLLLGRFTEGRMVVLERLREKLRDLGYVPMVFNFDKPETKDFTETVRLLANLCRFVIVDITNPRSAPLELEATVPDYMVPFAPILQEGEKPFAMFVDLQNKYDWVLQPVIGYPSVDRLIEVMEEKIVRPAEAKSNELLTRRTKQLRIETV